MKYSDLESEWSRYWFQFIKDNPDKEWDWGYICCNENLTWEILKNYSEKVDVISDGFDKWKIESEGEVMGKRLTKAIRKYEFWKDPNVIYYMFSYKNIPVGFCVYLISNNICYQLVNKSIGHDKYDQEFDINLLEDQLREAGFIDIEVVRVKKYERKGLRSSSRIKGNIQSKEGEEIFFSRKERKIS